MPRAKLTDEQIQDEGEKLFLEHAKAYYRDLWPGLTHQKLSDVAVFSVWCFQKAFFRQSV